MYTPNVKVNQSFLLVFIVICFLGATSHLYAENDAREVVKTFMRHLKNKNFDKVEEQLTSTEKNNLKIRSGDSIEVDGRKMGFGALIDKNTTYKVKGFQKEKGNTFSNVKVVVKKGPKSQIIPFQVKKVGGRWKISLKKTISEVVERFKERKRNLQRQSTWKLHKTFTERANRILDVEICISKSILVVVSETEVGFSLNVRSLTNEKNIFQKGFDNVNFTGVDISPSGNLLAVSMKKTNKEKDPGVIMVFETETWNRICKLTRNLDVGSPAFSPSGKYLCFAVSGGVQLWNTMSMNVEKKLNTPRKLRRFQLSKLEFSPRNKTYLVGVYKIRERGKKMTHLVVWDYKKKQLIGVSDSTNYNISSCEFIRSSSRVAIGGEKSPIILYDIPSLKRVKSLTGQNYYITSILYVEPNKIIYSDYIKKPKLLNMQSDSKTVLKNGDRRVRDMDISNKGKYFIVGSRSGSLQIWKKGN